MVEIVNVHDAKTHLSQLLARVEAGEEVTLARAGRPVARLVPIRRERAVREAGSWRGRVRIAADFDGLPPEIATAFAGDGD